MQTLQSHSGLCEVTHAKALLFVTFRMVSVVMIGEFLTDRAHLLLISSFSYLHHPHSLWGIGSGLGTCSGRIERMNASLKSRKRLEVHSQAGVFN